MNAFAGFWIDGAVRKPERKHASRYGSVFVRRKDESDILTVIYNSGIDWDSVYWLDTTPRKLLTPEELFSVVRVIMPSADKVNRSQVNPNSFALDPHAFEYTPIEWGNLTQYPPPAEPQWIRVTRENVARYLFSSCRYGDTEPIQWNGGCVVGWDVEDDCCLVDCNIDSPDKVMKFNIVEVQNAPTS